MEFLLIYLSICKVSSHMPANKIYKNIKQPLMDISFTVFNTFHYLSSHVPKVTKIISHKFFCSHTPSFHNRKEWEKKPVRIMNRYSSPYKILKEYFSAVRFLISTRHDAYSQGVRNDFKIFSDYHVICCIL